MGANIHEASRAFNLDYLNTTNINYKLAIKYSAPPI
jgi:hypothetical protein